MAELESGNANSLPNDTHRPDDNEHNIVRTQWNKPNQTLQLLNTILIGIFQVESQGGVSSVFKTHPILIKSYIVAIVIYVFACVCCTPGVLPSSVVYDTYIPILKATAFLMGTLATTLLLLVLVPVFGWIVFAIWVLLCVSLAWRVRAEIVRMIRLAIDTLFKNPA